MSEPILRVLAYLAVPLLCGFGLGFLYAAAYLLHYAILGYLPR